MCGSPSGASIRNWYRANPTDDNMSCEGCIPRRVGVAVALTIAVQVVVEVVVVVAAVCQRMASGSTIAYLVRMRLL